MGNRGAKTFGMEEAAMPTNDSVAGIVAQVQKLKTHRSRLLTSTLDRYGHEGEGFRDLCRLEWREFPVVELTYHLKSSSARKVRLIKVSTELLLLVYEKRLGH